MNLLFQSSLTSLIFCLPVYLYHVNLISPLTLKCSLCIISIIAFLLPAVFRCSLWLQRAVLYLNFLDKPANEDLQHLDRFNLTNGRNFYVSNGDLKLGVWHLLPDSLQPHSRHYSDDDFEDSLSNGRPVCVYLHGNIGSRGSEHRLELYRLLTRLEYHVVTFDYRSYGDSSYSHPHERALAEDGLAIYEWVQHRAGESPVFVWGHSLGTGLTTHMVALAVNKGRHPQGVVLEAPFDCMPSEIKVHPFGTVFRVLPWYNLLFSQPYYNNDESFDSAKHVLTFRSPLLILHSEDDGIIPSHLGVKLYQIARRERPVGWGTVDIVLFNKNRKLGHKLICQAPELPEIIKKFVDKNKNSEFSN